MEIQETDKHWNRMDLIGICQCRWRMRYVVFRGLINDDLLCVSASLLQRNSGVGCSRARVSPAIGQVPLWWLGGGGNTSSGKLRTNRGRLFRSPLQIARSLRIE